MRNSFLWVLFLVPVLACADPLRVFVSVQPLKTFVEKVGAEHVDVRAMVEPGFNPHTYDPTPKQIAELTKAVLYFRTGVPFEQSWMQRIRSANPEMWVKDVREGIDLRKMEEHEQDRSGDRKSDLNGVGQRVNLDSRDRHHRSMETDPHVWTDPMLATQMADNIRDALARLDPENALDYRRNYEVFAGELDRLDSDIRTLLEDVPSSKFLVFHPAWGYFADAYGLIQVPIEREGKEPGPRALAALIEQAKREQVKVIFVQPQFSRKSAERVANAIGGRVVAIDPLSADYTNNLRNVARQIAEAARK